jgi:hypothetical protein
MNKHDWSVGQQDTVTAVLRRAVEAYPDQTYLIMPDGKMTYAEADRRSNALANGLKARGDLPIDNNRAENAISPFVVGRKNWLFSDTPQGANASAIIYSVIETAKANGREPYAYLRRLFTDLPAATSLEAIEQLLPWTLAPDQLT